MVKYRGKSVISATYEITLALKRLMTFNISYISIKGCALFQIEYCATHLGEKLKWYFDTVAAPVLLYVNMVSNWKKVEEQNVVPGNVIPQVSAQVLETWSLQSIKV